MAEHRVGSCISPNSYGNDLVSQQAEFAMRQRPVPFFFRSITLMKARTVRLDTLTYYQGQFPQTRERGDRAMAVIGHPQRLATLLTTLFQRGQRLLMRRFQARGSSSHTLSPVVLISLLLVSGYTPCQVFFAIQHPVGTWQVKVTAASQASTVEDGPLKGQTAEGLVIFEPDHTLLSLTPGPGAGTWQSGGPNSISFDFTELINYDARGTFTGFAIVTQQGSLSEDGNTFTSSGQGVLYDAAGTYITTHTTTQATRVSQFAEASVMEWGLRGIAVAEQA